MGRMKNAFRIKESDEHEVVVEGNDSERYSHAISSSAIFLPVSKRNRQRTDIFLSRAFPPRRQKMTGGPYTLSQVVLIKSKDFGQRPRMPSLTMIAGVPSKVVSAIYFLHNGNVALECLGRHDTTLSRTHHSCYTLTKHVHRGLQSKQA